MANEVSTGPESTMTGLLTGIVNDAQELIKQQLALFRAEIRDDFQKTKEVALSFLIGASVLLLGGLLLVLMLPLLLNWIWPQLPLWACFGIIGGILAGVGGALCYAGKKTMDSFNPLPDQSVEALRENVQWLTKPR
jgi:uncharacterized membrane protein YqjE